MVLDAHVAARGQGEALPLVGRLSLRGLSWKRHGGRRVERRRRGRGETEREREQSSEKHVGLDASARGAWLPRKTKARL
jgi:hypothetical protein